MGLRPLTRAELPLLGEWLARPHVRRWWQHDPSPEAVERDFGAAVDGDEPTDLLAVLVDGRPVGMVQRYLLASYPEYRDVLDRCGGVPTSDAAGIDYLIGDPALVGRGLGTATIDAVTVATFRDLPGVRRVVVAVLQANVASWRALERAGYRLVWSGDIESDDPSEAGPNHVLVRERRAAHQRRGGATASS